MRPALTSREVLLLTVSGALALCAAHWMLVVEPARETRASSLAQLSKLNTMEQLLITLPADRPQQGPRSQAPLSRRITETARAAGLEIQRLDPQGAALGVTLEEVAFQDLVTWIDALNAQASVRVRAAEIGRVAEPGTVSARLLFEDAG